ncbi:MAG TPA: metalloregulator ArsR/SmtB family transcription factor [Pseudogracilibacillus sp.]|nr:metalloregulator ArsR/SmtB family transcription factor [Pseudogracilibacillus sp.]
MTESELQMDEAAAILKILGHESRLTILKLLEKKASCVCEFVELFQMSQPAISQHLRKMKDLDLVEEERRGQWIYYSLNEAHESFDFIKDLLHLLPAQDHLIEQLKESRISCD